MGIKSGYKMSNENAGRLSKKQKQVGFRRQAVFSLLAKGTTSTYEIAEVLQISQSTASRDVQFLKIRATAQLKSHITQTLPWTYIICSEGISQVLKCAWSLLVNNDAKVNKVAVLSLIEQCYKDKLEISTNAFVITQALDQVALMKKQIQELHDPKPGTVSLPSLQFHT